MAEEPKDTSPPSTEAPEEVTKGFLDRVVSRNRQLYSDGILQEAYDPSGKGVGYVPSVISGGGRRGKKEDTPPIQDPVTALLEEIRAEKSNKVNGSLSRNPDETISKLVVKGHLKMFSEAQRCLSVKNNGMQDALIHLGIKNSEDHALFEEDLKKATKGLPAEKFKALADKKTVPLAVVSSLKEGNVDRLIELGMLNVEPSLSRSALFAVKAESVKAMEDMGLQINHKDGKFIIERDALHSKLAANGNAVHSLLTSPVELTAQDIVAGLVKRGLICRISYASTDAGSPHELRVRSDAAVGALESVGANVDHLPGGARIIQRTSLIKAFGNNEYSLNKVLSTATLYLRERPAPETHRR